MKRAALVDPPAAFKVPVNTGSRLRSISLARSPKAAKILIHVRRVGRDRDADERNRARCTAPASKIAWRDVVLTGPVIYIVD
jgi:hypothetical protein